MSNNKPLVLASASPRRKELLATLFDRYTVIPSTVDEPALIERLGNISPPDLVQQLALEKARDVFRFHQDSIVIGADTVVVLDGTVLGKPADEVDAFSMLSRLSGRTHEVFTGIAIVSDQGFESDALQTRVRFKTLTSKEIRAYIATGEPLDKAGSYGIQNTDISPVSWIDGDYFNVVGLPVERTRELLLKYYPDLPPSPEQPSILREK